jgi:predicted ATPase
MAKLLGIRVRNFRSLSDFSLGRRKYGDDRGLPQLICLIGPNGAGKSSVLDAFGFIADCLAAGVEAACDKPSRGGFERLRTQGSNDPIKFTLFFEDGDPIRPIVYDLEIDLVAGVPSVTLEELRQRRPDQARGKPYYFLKLKNGSGKVWADEMLGLAADTSVDLRINFTDQDRLGITTLGNLADHPRIVKVRSYIEQWYLSYFVPDAARTLPSSGAQPWLDRTGSNVGNVLQYYQRQHPERFKSLLARIAAAIPGIQQIDTATSEDKRLLISFNERGYKDPFYQQSMSDGTLKLLAYAVLLEAPSPRPFIGIEEPENGLYVEIVEELARELAKRASDPASPTQILVTTHSPYFVDGLTPENVWIVRKGADGHTTARWAADFPDVRALQSEGIPLGSLWYSRHFDILDR